MYKDNHFLGYDLETASLNTEIIGRMYYIITGISDLNYSKDYWGLC